MTKEELDIVLENHNHYIAEDCEGWEDMCADLRGAKNITYDKNFIYKVGEVVEVKDFNGDRWDEYSTGIHFFINRQEAINY